MPINLWEQLKISKQASRAEIDRAYSALPEDEKPKKHFAWKVLRDDFYRAVYAKYEDIPLLIKAGFIENNLTPEQLSLAADFNFLTTPLPAIKPFGKDICPVVLLSTGGFYPLHEGHLKMMNLAKEFLERKGRAVAGGYFSISHSSYTNTKNNFTLDGTETIYRLKQTLAPHPALKADPWESCYAPAFINFTEVIYRLQNYLKKHFHPNTQVAYVFGADNANFMYCFESLGLGICVERDGYQELFDQLKNKLESEHCVFISHSGETAKANSSALRAQKSKEQIFAKAERYYIRQEGISALKNWPLPDDEKTIFYKNFAKGFKTILRDALGAETKISYLSAKAQTNRAKKALQGKKVISLDRFFEGDYNISLSRNFTLGGENLAEQKYYFGEKSLAEQFKNIPSGSYVLAEDDSATGGTLKTFFAALPPRINIENLYFTAKTNGENSEFLDSRDFILGAYCGGLIITLPDGKICRAPYLLPYVSPSVRSKIPPRKEKAFSISLWRLNYELFSRTSKPLRVKDISPETRPLLAYIGFSPDDFLTNICLYHLERLCL